MHRVKITLPGSSQSVCCLRRTISTSINSNREKSIAPSSSQRNQYRNTYQRSPVVNPSLSPNQLLDKIRSALKSDWLKSNSIPLSNLAKDVGVPRDDLNHLASKFAAQTLSSLEVSRREWDLEGLRLSYLDQGMDSVNNLILAKFFQYIATSDANSINLKLASRSSISKLSNLAKMADFRNAGEFYPFARRLKRKLILHVGPTNSGKTYAALVALARARTGVYAGPLRLLAHEVFSRFNEGKIGSEGKRLCNLITGEEQRILDPNQSLSSCTVEMFPLNRRLEVGVIDEIQMIGDPQRGSAWTNAILGSQCDELHMCGEESVVELVQKIAADLGDECVVNRYERLSPLAIAPNSLRGQLDSVRAGDCVVTFSRNNIFALKRLIEEKTGLRVAVAYGGLPPEVREEQARMFNAGGYDVLVASDAVGMGLNLKIKRIIFETIRKWDPKSRSEIQLTMPQIKQIAGRAGRFGFNDANGTVAGEVTTLDDGDMSILRAAMKSSTTPLTKAALLAPFTNIKTFSSLLPSATPLSKTLQLITTIGATMPHYFSSPHNGPQSIADAIQHIGRLTLGERIVFTNSPANMRDEMMVKTLVAWVETYAEGKKILMKDWGVESDLFQVLDVIEDAQRARIPSSSSAPSPSSPAPFVPTLSIFNSIYTPLRLAQLESFHRALTLYLWFSFRLRDIFTDHLNADLLRRRVEKAIDFTLEGMKFERRSAVSPKRITKEKQQRLIAFDNDNVAGPRVSL